MKRLLIAAAVALSTVTPPALAADVGVSISIGQPGFFGQLDIGDFPRPQLINPQPIVIERGYIERPPIYLRVPPGHAKHWRKHCHQYNACGERVYFVQDGWYNREYAPRYMEQHRDHQDEGRDEHRNERRGERDERRDDYRGKGDRQGDDHDRGRDH